VRPRVRPLPADDHELRAQHVDEPRHGAPEHGSGVGVDRAGPRVAGVGERAQAGDPVVRVEDPGGAPAGDEPRVPDQRLEAAPVAAAAHGPVGVDADVAELAGAPAGAAVDLAVDDDPQADAAAHGDRDEVGDVVPAAVEALRHGEGVDVVVDEDRHAERVLELVAQREARPAEHGGVHASAHRDPGDAEADPEHDRAVRAGREPRTERLGQALHEVGRRGGERLVEALEHLGVEVRADAHEPVRGDLHAEGLGGERVQPEQQRRAPAMGRRLLDDADQPLLDQPARGARDGGRAEPQAARDVDARDRPLAAVAPAPASPHAGRRSVRPSCGCAPRAWSGTSPRRRGRAASGGRRRARPAPGRRTPSPSTRARRGRRGR